MRSEFRAVYLRSLALLLQAGVPIDRSLTVLSKGSSERLLAAASLRMAESLQRGTTLSQAMLGCPQAFQLFHAEAVHLGERTGQLDKVLLRLAEQDLGVGDAGSVLAGGKGGRGRQRAEHGEAEVATGGIVHVVRLQEVGARAGLNRLRRPSRASAPANGRT